MVSLRCGTNARDDSHGSAAIWADQLGADSVFVDRVRQGGGDLRLCFFGKESAARRDIFGPAAIRHESEVADAMEAVGQGMEQKTADELVRLQPHDLPGAVLTVILPAECDVIVVESFEAIVGYSDAMGVAAEICENLGGGRRTACWRRPSSQCGAWLGQKPCRRPDRQVAPGC